MELLKIVASINVAILIGGFTYYLIKGTIGSRGYWSATMLVGSVVLGGTIASYLPQGRDVVLSQAINCEDFGFWHECGGWMFYYDSIASFVNAFADSVGIGFSIPVSVALLLGSWYLHSRLLTGLSFEPSEILKAFAAGFFVYCCLVYLPELQGHMSNFIIELTAPVQAVSRGREVLTNWGEAIALFDAVASEETSLLAGMEAFTLRAFLAIPFALSDGINLIIIMLQYSMLALVPISLFMSSLQKNADPTYLLALLGSYAILSVLQAGEWFAISRLPAIEIPNDLQELSISQLFGPALRSMVLFIFLMLAMMKVATFVLLPALQILIAPRLLK